MKSKKQNNHITEHKGYKKNAHQDSRLLEGFSRPKVYLQVKFSFVDVIVLFSSDYLVGTTFVNCP